MACAYGEKTHCRLGRGSDMVLQLLYIVEIFSDHVNTYIAKSDVLTLSEQ